MEGALSPRQSRSHPHPHSQSRDLQLIDFIGRQGLATIDHVMAALGVKKAAAYRRTAICIEARLLERFEFPLMEPALLRATRRGLHYAGLGLSPVVVSPGSVHHRLRCTSLAQLLAEEFKPSEIFTERELIQAERLADEPLFSARLPKSHHRPDLAIQAPTQTIAIELELSPKAPRRLQQIIHAWTKATWVTEVRYYCEPGPTRRGLERAIANTDASSRVRILEAPLRKP